eukprot:1006498-Rhodomonas_salina.2
MSAALHTAQGTGTKLAGVGANFSATAPQLGHNDLEVDKVESPPWLTADGTVQATTKEGFLKKKVSCAATYLVCFLCAAMFVLPGGADGGADGFEVAGACCRTQTVSHYAPGKRDGST